MADEIGIGMLGYAFMGKAHANAYRKIAYMTWPPPLVPRLVSISGRNEEAVAEAARRYGFEGYVTDWHEQVADDRRSAGRRRRATRSGRPPSRPA
jgi:predicted dehydrogenase